MTVLYSSVRTAAILHSVSCLQLLPNPAASHDYIYSHAKCKTRPPTVILRKPELCQSDSSIGNRRSRSLVSRMHGVYKRARRERSRKSQRRPILLDPTTIHIVPIRRTDCLL